MDLFTYTVIAILGLIGGFVGALVGGAGLILIPGLLLLGIPVQSVIATIKFAALGMMLSAIAKFRTTQKPDVSLSINSTIVASIGAYFGARTMLYIPETILERIVAVCLISVLILVLFNKDLGVTEMKTVTHKHKAFGYLLFFAIGFWGSFFGGGWAIVAVYAYLFYFGSTFLEAAYLKMIVGLGIALISIIVYGLFGVIDWGWGTLLFFTEAIGAYIGASFAVHKGNRFIRLAFVVMVTVSSLKLLF